MLETRPSLLLTYRCRYSFGRESEYLCFVRPLGCVFVLPSLCLNKWSVFLITVQPAVCWLVCSWHGLSHLSASLPSPLSLFLLLLSINNMTDADCVMISQVRVHHPTLLVNNWYDSLLVHAAINSKQTRLCAWLTSADWLKCMHTAKWNYTFKTKMEDWDKLWHQRICILAGLMSLLFLLLADC